MMAYIAGFKRVSNDRADDYDGKHVDDDFHIAAKEGLVFCRLLE
jgi:hypothetical protein